MTEQLVKKKGWSKDFFIVAIVMTGILLPVRLLFVEYVSDSTWGSLGLISVISIIIVILAKKKKLGWFGRMFENEMTRLTQGKRRIFIVSWLSILALYFAISMVAIDQGMTIYHDETMRIYEIVMEKYNLDFQQTDTVVSTLDPEQVIGGVDEYADAMVNDFKLIAITQAIINVASDGFLLHFHTVFFVETVEVLGVFTFYAVTYRKHRLEKQKPKKSENKSLTQYEDVERLKNPETSETYEEIEHQKIPETPIETPTKVVKQKPKKFVMKLDWRLTVITFVCFIVFNPIISIVHEYGHAYVCAGNGYEFLIQPSLTGTYFSCEKFVGEGAEALRTQMYLYGGLFASATAFLGYMVLHRSGILRGRGRGIGFALVTIGIMQFIQMVLETFAHDFYMQGQFTIPIMSITSLVLLCIFLFRGSQQYLEHGIIKPRNPYAKYREDIPENIFKRSIVDIIKGNKPLSKKPQSFVEESFESFETPTLNILKDREDEV